MILFQLGIIIGILLILVVVNHYRLKRIEYVSPWMVDSETSLQLQNINSTQKKEEHIFPRFQKNYLTHDVDNDFEHNHYWQS
tara:strand:- start:424 stop:669 length:246 start_codon:yes stop_codon:yes gene_type:complete